MRRHPSPTPRTSTPGRLRWWTACVAVVALLAATLAACSGGRGSDERGALVDSRASDAPEDDGPPWQSGVWLGGAVDVTPVDEFGRWRGAPVDTLTTYPAYETWRQLAESDWNVETFGGFEGRLVYGLPLLPSEQPATLREVAQGRHDDVFRSVASHLVDNGRRDSYVRVGLEANGTWFPWGADAATAADFRDAFRRVVGVLRDAAPDLRFVFDISCSVGLEGDESGDRLASLTALYPGDDVVDVIGCDHYDSFTAAARTEAEWRSTLRPETGPGLLDVVEFARERGKPFAVPEWGVVSTRADGAGDNPFFVRKMHAFFAEHQGELAFENYFDEPDDYLGSALFLEPQNPRSAEVYRELW